ncbi:MAG: DNA ligase (NAD(+)) LigA [Candidatus Dadabacteria bacterium]|nr:MAG: DNA ligase (NAD(+)) LigA [Candidatus Dadabacteria bacterium]
MYTEEKQKELIEKSDKLLKTLKEERLEGLSTAEAKALAESLREVISFHDWRYYVLSDPVISDGEYDKLFSTLVKLEKLYPELESKESPTQRVASGLTEGFPTVRHLVPMLSLQNSYNLDDLKDFIQRVEKLVKRETSYTVEPKFDGAGIALVYENNLLVRGATRGDGQTGEDITVNLRVLKSVPLKADFSSLGIVRAEIRGEVLMDKETFVHLNKERLEAGENLFANPRNAVAGSLRLLDPSQVAKRGLVAFLYHLAYAVDKEEKDLLGTKAIPTHLKAMEILSKLGFKCPINELKVFNKAEQIISYCKEWEEKRDSYPYELDGMVIKVNELSLYNTLGSTSHHPRWAIAFKFKARQGTTVLKEVVFQVGRTGVVTPVGKLEAVQIGGVTVSSVSLINEDFVKEKDIRIGDKVLIERAGDVIPYVVKVIKEARKGDEKPLVFPKKCPVCKTALIRPAGEAHWRCPNINCPSQVKERLIHFASKDGMDIQGLGKRTVELFYKLGLLKNIPDIYRLNYQQIAKLEGFGEKSAENLKQAVEQSKNQPLYKLIYALGIRYVGKSTAKTLAEFVTDLRDLKNVSLEELETLPDIGEKVAESIYQFFHNKENIKMLDQLEKLGVRVKKEEKKKKEGKLSGEVFLFTGTLHSFSRQEASKRVEELGAEVVNSISRKVTYLVVGENPGSKLEKAKKYPSIKIINEEEFLQLINN